MWYLDGSLATGNAFKFFQKHVDIKSVLNSHTTLCNSTSSEHLFYIQFIIEPIEGFQRSKLDFEHQNSRSQRICKKKREFYGEFSVTVEGALVTASLLVYPHKAYKRV